MPQQPRPWDPMVTPPFQPDKVFASYGLDHVLILHRDQLHRIVQEYLEYYNRSRPHQGLSQQIPERFAEGCPWPVSQPEPGGKIISTPVLGGLHHCYSWAAVNST